MSDNPKVKRVCVIIEFDGLAPQQVEFRGDDLKVCMTQRREVAAIYREGAIDPTDVVPTGYSGMGLMVNRDDSEEHKKFLSEPGERIIKPGLRLEWPRDWT